MATFNVNVNVGSGAEAAGKVPTADGSGGIDWKFAAATDGNPEGISPISSAEGVAPIEFRRFIDSATIDAQANTGSVSFNLKFSGAGKYHYSDALGEPTEGDITPAGRALLDDADPAAQRTTLGLGTAATQPSSAFDASGSAAAAQAAAIQRSNHTGTQAASTISDFADTVRATVLTGLSLASSAAVAATDSILTAFGKLQAFNNLFTTVGLAIGRLANPSAVRFLRINADNTVTARSAAELRTDLGLGTAAVVNTGTGSGDVPTITQADARYIRSRLAVLGSDFTTTSNTPVDVTGLAVTLDANSTYVVEVIAMGQSANASTGVNVTLTISGSPTHRTFDRRAYTAAVTALDATIGVDDGGAGSTTIDTPNVNRPVNMTGIVVTSGSPSTLQIRLYRGGSANDVRVMAGATIIARKVA